MTATQPDNGAQGSGPTVLRILLGAQLRELREARGISREDAGYHIRASDSKISRMELGRVSFKQRDVADLLTLYGVTDKQERDVLLSLAKQANTPGWWHKYSDVLPPWFQSFLGLEGAAAVIRTYEIQFIPGLLQTPEYARAVIMLRHSNAREADVDRRIKLRRARQQLLDRADPPLLWAVIDEAALRRVIGGRDVMRAQVEALLDANRRSNIRLQVLPFRAGGHAGAGGAFTILRFPERELPDVVYVEQLTGALYLDKREDVDEYAIAMERLSVEAEPPDHTPAVLEKLLHDLEAPD